MRILVSFIVMVALCGCRCPCAPDLSPLGYLLADVLGSEELKYELVGALESRCRDETNLALWTLKKNGREVPKIDFDRSYAEAKPKLDRLVKELRGLAKKELYELDESLRHHRSIYSPSFPPDNTDGWLK